MASTKFCCELKFCVDADVVSCVTDGALRADIRRLEQELEKKDAIIAGLKALLADRDAQIAKLSADVATLQKLVNTLMAQRGGGMRVPKGQGLLFADGEQDVAAADAPNGEEDDDDEADSRPAKPPTKGTKRTPGKIDTTGLPRRREVHDLPEDQRIDPISGRPLVPIGERVTEELDYQRGQIQVKEHVQILYGLPPEEAEHRVMAPKAAPLPPKPFDNCIAGAILLAWILVQKFCKDLCRNNRSLGVATGSNCVVPVTMERMRLDEQLVHLCVADDLPLRVATLVEFAADAKPTRSLRGSN